MADNTHAVGQMQGYMLQVRHMLFELISLNPITVSIEKLDDVAIESSDGSVIAEQIKSVTSDDNPLANRSVVFWKTINNWLEYINNGTLNLDTTIFRMVVVANKALRSGDFIEAFHNSTDEAKAYISLQSAREGLWGKKNELKNKIPDSYSGYLKNLFDAKNESVICKIISKMSIDVHENDYDEKLYEKFRGIPALIPEFVESLLIYMLGWVTDKVNEQARNGQVAFIENAEFNKALQTQMRMYNQRDALPALSQAIDENVIITEVNQQDIYIQQLDLIDVDFDSKLEAASEYIRTRTEITLRAESGLFTPQSLTEYNEKMKQTWKDRSRLIAIAHADTDVNKGKMLYFGLRESASSQKLQGNEVPSFFGAGVLQTLANEPKEEPEIGWHPEYKALLKAGESNDG